MYFKIVRKGFTLVELSIVLIIIGLLIGGILAAQSMISTVKIQSVVRQLQQYDAAIANFQTKYNQLPGDSTLFNTVGNNNGEIAEPSHYDELGNFWADLSNGVALLNAKGTAYQVFDPNATFPSEANCPKLNIDQNGSGQPCLAAIYVDTATNYAYTDIGAKNYLYYDIVSPGNGLLTGSSRSVLKPKDSLAIDQKIDDGLPGSGNVLIGGTGCTSSATAYNLANNTYVCELNYQIGASNGLAN